jgi:putative (di)nucleoside polyphosphate hydrolase
VSAPAELPYRPNVGAVVFNPAGLVFIGRRANIGDPAGPAWQLPQGGIDDGEDPATAVRRELAEETGIERVTLLAEHDAWLTYDLPAELVGRAFGGRYRGQRQRWFALRFEGADSDIRLDAHGTPEFDAWRWAPLAELPGLAVPFKRPVYEVIAAAFAPYAAPALPADTGLQQSAGAPLAGSNPG